MIKNKITEEKQEELKETLWVLRMCIDTVHEQERWGTGMITRELRVLEEVIETWDETNEVNIRFNGTMKVSREDIEKAIQKAKESNERLIERRKILEGAIKSKKKYKVEIEMSEAEYEVLKMDLMSEDEYYDRVLYEDEHYDRVRQEVDGKSVGEIIYESLKIKADRDIKDIMESSKILLTENKGGNNYEN